HASSFALQQVLPDGAGEAAAGGAARAVELVEALRFERVRGVGAPALIAPRDAVGGGGHLLVKREDGGFEGGLPEVVGAEEEGGEDRVDDHLVGLGTADPSGTGRAGAVETEV